MSSLGSHAPAYGGRVELRLQALSADVAEYEALLSAHEEKWSLRVEVEVSGGKVTWRDAPDLAPLWLRTFAEALLRGAWRTRESQPWPRRITRWRSAKDDD